jgi:hypothetical protein
MGEEQCPVTIKNASTCILPNAINPINRIIPSDRQNK